MARARDAEAAFNLPPGFRFYPTDEELVVHYLCRKAAHHRLPAPIIAEVDLYKYDPWQLPDKALFGQREWYFFTPRERKYPKGTRPNRAAGSGYWKATGADRPVTPAGSARPLGIKKALVFYAGKSPNGVKTNWIMHEYRLADANRAANREGEGGGSSLRLDDWVLCRLYNKKNTWEQTPLFQAEAVSAGDAIMDLFELPDDTCSDSLRTLESEVDNDVHLELRGNGNPFGLVAPQVPRTDHPPGASTIVAGGGDQVAVGIKEDDDWLGELNLDGLGSSPGPAFGGAPTSIDFAYQDYVAALAAPHLKPGHDTLPPF